MSVKLKTYT